MALGRIIGPSAIRRFSGALAENTPAKRWEAPGEQPN